jgi:hypothetical protein
MGFLLESLSKLCSCVPLIDKQAIEDPIHISAMKPIRLTENPLLSKTESLGDCAAAREGRLVASFVFSCFLFILSTGQSACLFHWRAQEAYTSWQPENQKGDE